MTTLHIDPILEKPAERKSIGISEPVTEASNSSGPSSLAPESLSSASSFQSLSSKSSSGICIDSAPGSPDKTVILASANHTISNFNVNEDYNSSYVNADIPDLDDLISACANINLGQYRDDSNADLSQDQTFASAGDESIGNTTQVFVEETIQTFKTCPGLETQVSEESKSLEPVDQPSKESTSGDLATSSVIPYVSFEQSVLRKDSAVEEHVEVPSLKVDPPKRRSYSPTPCVEIDIAQLPVPENDGFLFDSIAPTLETVDGFGTPDVSFQEVQAFNSSVPLRTDDDNSVAENCNLTTFVSAVEKTEAINNVVEAAHESNVLNKTQDIVVENKLFEIVEENNILNNTQDIAVGNNHSLNKTQEIVKENVPLNRTQEFAKEENHLNKTQKFIKENTPLNQTQDLAKEENLLNKTQEFIKENTPVNQTREFVKEKNHSNRSQEFINEENLSNITQESIKRENILNETQDIVQEEIPLNKTQEIIKDISVNQTQEAIKEESLYNKTQELVKENSLNTTHDLIPEANNVNKTQGFIAEEKVLNTTQNTHGSEEDRSSLSTVKSVSIDTNKFDGFKEPIITVKTPSKLYERNDLKITPNLESFCGDETQEESYVVSSTPLHWKREEDQTFPKRKGALFNQEPKSPPQCTSPAALSKNFNSPSKDKATKEQENKVNFDQTVAVNKSFEKSLFGASDVLPSQEPEYEAFKPQQQSTTLPFSAQCPNFQALQEAALSVAKDIDESLEKIEEEQFVSATTELFGDPGALDFLTQAGSQPSNRGERYDSLFMKFDPLAQRQSMLPQKNLPVTPALEEEVEQRETKVDTPIGNADTPKKNPALAAIDRLLFYSPCPPATTDSEKVEAKQKKEEAEKKEPQSVPIVNEEMAKELELVRSTVLQLEAELEKQKHEHEKKLEKQRVAYDEKVMQVQAKFGQMQSQLSQETKCKDQMTVVVEEYEKSISRLIAEREKEKQTFTQERDRMKAELDISQQHLANSEAAFTDVHSKYERLKSVVTAYKSNEEVLKESIAENQDTIKTLENRYEQLKSHAMAQLEKANLELNAMKKQHEAEVLKLKAMVRKTELRCKTLEETVEQRSKENKELTKIIDEMIARVD